MFWLLPLVGAASGAVLNKKNPLAGAAMGAVGGAAPGLLGAAAAPAAGAASGAGGLLAGGTLGVPAGGIAMGGSMAGAAPAAGLLSEGITIGGGAGAAGAAGGGLMETMKPFMNAAKTVMETAQATQQPEEQMQPSPFLMPPQGGPGPQQMAQLVQSIEQDKAQRFPQRVRRY